MKVWKKEDIDYFLFYFEDDVEQDAEGDEKARALITYIRGKALKFYFDKFASDGKLSEDCEDYEKVEVSLKEEFKPKGDVISVIEGALSLIIEVVTEIRELVKHYERL